MSIVGTSVGGVPPSSGPPPPIPLLIYGKVPRYVE